MMIGHQPPSSPSLGKVQQLQVQPQQQQQEHNTGLNHLHSVRLPSKWLLLAY
jgi:hypothetical protein